MNSKSKPRLFGIDLFRGIAAYAVVLLHSGDASLGLPISQEAIALRLPFYFAVPFFLATSFYFLTSKDEIDTSPKFWRSRIDRILIPYAIWSVIFVIFRLSFFVQSQKMDRFWDYLKDPLGIFFFGGASYQLYFLPLLFTGTFLVLIAKYLQNLRINRLVIGILAIISIIIYELLFRSGNAFQLAPNTAFQSLIENFGINIGELPLLRIFLVPIAWVLACLPYLFMGIFLLPLFKQVSQWNNSSRLVGALVCGIVFILTSLAIFIGIPDTLKNILQAYSLLLLSIILSNYIKSGGVFQNIGLCSFGIYLIHPLVMQGVKGLFIKALPVLANEVSVLSIMTVSITCFLISWLVVAVLMKNKWIAKYALGA